MTAPYKATQMKAVNPLSECAIKGEMSFHRYDGPAAKSTIPAKADAKSAMHDGPFGGKKPA